jgi:hypothetical protein
LAKKLPKAKARIFAGLEHAVSSQNAASHERPVTSATIRCATTVRAREHAGFGNIRHIRLRPGIAVIANSVDTVLTRPQRPGSTGTQPPGCQASINDGSRPWRTATSRSYPCPVVERHLPRTWSGAQFMKGVELYAFGLEHASDSLSKLWTSDRHWLRLRCE